MQQFASLAAGAVEVLADVDGGLVGRWMAVNASPRAAWVRIGGTAVVVGPGEAVSGVVDPPAEVTIGMRWPA